MSILEFHHVSVDFPTVRVPSLKEWAIRKFRGSYQQQYFPALRDVSFTLNRGGCLGVIGRNGAGKSTLLRIAAGVIPPTAGEAVVRGTVAPLIELGTGFDAELTGRENIFFNAALLGRSRADVHSKMDEIIDFSGISAFIDTPLRTYSTGMIARLAFSIATTVEAELILLDEILAVGDAAFQQQCEERILGFFRSGRTIVLVSHDLASIRRLCTEVIWLHDGRVREAGTDDEVIDDYEMEAGPRSVVLSLRGDISGEVIEPAIRVEPAPALTPRSQPAPSDDVLVLVPEQADRNAATLLEQRLHAIGAHTIVRYDPRSGNGPRPTAGARFVMIVTDPLLLLSHSIVDRLRASLEAHDECFAAVPAMNASDEVEQNDATGRPYWTVRQFDEVTDWLGRKVRPARELTWTTGNPGVVLVRQSALQELKPPYERAIVGKRVVVDRGSYVHRFPRYHSLSRPDLVERIAPGTRSVLDVFCGEGAFGAALKEMRGCRVAGIEPNPEAAARAKSRLDAVWVGSPRTAVAGIQETFDAIVAGDRFAEETDPVGLLSDLRRLCKPEGQLLLSFHNIGTWTVISDLLLGRFDYAYMAALAASSLRFYTRHSIESLLPSAGWEIASIERQPHAQTAESRRLLQALDAASVPHNAEEMVNGGFYVIARPLHM